MIPTEKLLEMISRGKEVLGYPGYLITEDCQLISIKRPLSPIIMKSRNLLGYVVWPVRLNGKAMSIRAHRALMIAFKFNADYKMLEVDHIDGNKANNKLSNLRWCSRKENANYHFSSDRSLFGEKHNRAKLSNQDVIEIRRKYQRTARCKSNAIELAKEYGVSKWTIISIMKGLVWKRI